ncbi:repeat-containing protein [Musa troglodytarum]|uniref:Repeat-containing protein n=1 Tax=Musa troglodytarum TaxID=320322 RepID=A0A9E7L5L3_9LILI|nr:repeat-containing protein [Musa troglodytarum]
MTRDGTLGRRCFASVAVARRSPCNVLPAAASSFSSTSTPRQAADSLELDADAIAASVRCCRWPALDPLLPRLSHPLLSAVLLRLRPSPDLIPRFLHRVGFHRLDLRSLSTAAAILSSLRPPNPALQLLKQAISVRRSDLPKHLFDALVEARQELELSDPPVVFDLLLKAYADAGEPESALEVFYLMKDANFAPRIESCNALLSVLLKLDQKDRAWVLYAEMFRMRIPSTVVTFNIMINVLCKEGKLKKAKAFMQYMESFGVRPTVCHGLSWFCLNRAAPMRITAKVSLPEIS